jgi:hypothetical protein
MLKTIVSRAGADGADGGAGTQGEQGKIGPAGPEGALGPVATHSAGVMNNCTATVPGTLCDEVETLTCMTLQGAGARRLGGGCELADPASGHAFVVLAPTTTGEFACQPVCLLSDGCTATTTTAWIICSVP